MADVTESNISEEDMTVGSPFGDRKMDISWDDATWILTSSFIIFTMQSGFGLLESGMVSTKNEVNIMVKNCVDVLFGGLTFWMVGFGLAFGNGPYSNAFCGVGYFFLEVEESEMGVIFTWFIFQMSFATTSTTVVSGAMAERAKLSAYIVFCVFNTIIYCLPAHWVWDSRGFLRKLGVVDIAGAGAVHLAGGCSALVATLMLKPRLGRFENSSPPEMGCPTNSLVGMFMLWWGWLGFNCGSTFGISNGKWKLASRSAVATVCASMAGGVAGMGWSAAVNKRKYLVPDLINGILGSLVSVSSICALAQPWQSLVIGLIGGLLSVSTPSLLVKLNIDDPVSIFPVHGVSGIWAMLSVGLFAHKDNLQDLTYGRMGLFTGGGFEFLGVQALGVLVIGTWSTVCSFALLKVIDLTIGLRMSREDEEIGADWAEHGIRSVLPFDIPVAGSSSTSAEGRVLRRESLGLRRRGTQISISDLPSSHLDLPSGDKNVPQKRARAKVSFAEKLVIHCNDNLWTSENKINTDTGDIALPGRPVINEGSENISLCDSGVSSDEDKVQVTGTGTRPKRRRRPELVHFQHHRSHHEPCNGGHYVFSSV